MTLGDSLVELDPVTGIAAAIGTIVLWPFVSRVGRPIAKEIVKGGIRLYDAGANATAAVKDLVAEAQAE